MFCCRLALALGLTLEELDEKVSVPEFHVWRLYFAREPFGEYGAYYRAASVAAMLYNIQVAKPKDRITGFDGIFPSVFPEARRHTTRRVAGALISGAVRIEETGEALKARLEEVVGTSAASRAGNNHKVARPPA